MAISQTTIVSSPINQLQYISIWWATLSMTFPSKLSNKCGRDDPAYRKLQESYWIHNVKIVGSKWPQSRSLKVSTIFLPLLSCSFFCFSFSSLSFFPSLKPTGPPAHYDKQGAPVLHGCGGGSCVAYLYRWVADSWFGILSYWGWLPRHYNLLSTHMCCNTHIFIHLIKAFKG